MHVRFSELIFHTLCERQLAFVRTSVLGAPKYEYVKEILR